MNLAAWLALMSPLGAGDAPAAQHRDPRRQPLTVEDALVVVPDVCGRIQAVGDLDGDGLRDLLAQRGENRFGTQRVDAISSRSGERIRTLWDDAGSSRGSFVWDGSGDANGDGHPDLLIGFPDDCAIADRKGAILCVSGANGEPLLELHPSAPWEQIGWSIAYLGDIDCDGRDDFIAEELLNVPESQWSNDPVRRDTSRAPWQGEPERLNIRPRKAGFVSLRSGRDGVELWRAGGRFPASDFEYRARALGDIDGDGFGDLVVQRGPYSAEHARILSGKLGSLITTIASLDVLVGPTGDLDADGAVDWTFDEMDLEFGIRVGKMKAISGRSRKVIFSLPYPDAFSEWGVTVDIGDIDLDGVPDIALGDSNFNIAATGDLVSEGKPIDLRALTLREAIAIESNPRSISCESGCALVYSGRTREVIWGVWGAPSSGAGMGMDVAPLPDITGDGCPDLAVTDGSKAYFFAGPGKAPE